MSAAKPPTANSSDFVAWASKIAALDPELGDWATTYAHNHRERLAQDYSLVQSLASDNTRILEVGSVPLLLTAALAESGFLVQGVDLAPERFANSIEALDLNVSSCDVEREPLPFADRSVDLVLFNEIFEHLRIDPIFTLTETHRVLTAGGQLVLSTPNLRSLRGIRNLLLRNQGHACSAGVYRQYDKLRTLGHMGHVREYTSFEVSEFLEKVGFSVSSIRYRGGWGKGAVGVAERLAPALKPFMVLVASKS